MKEGTSTSAKNLSISSVKIFNSIGTLKKQLQFGTTTKNAQINIADLAPGTYMVEISDGKYKETQQLIIGK